LPVYKKYYLLKVEKIINNVKKRPATAGSFTFQTYGEDYQNRKQNTLAAV